MVGVLMVLLVVVVSAGLVYYFGRIVVTASVEGSVFYLNSSYVLLMNEKPSSSGTVTILNDGFKIWETGELGGIDFNYIPGANFYVRAKVNEALQNLTLIFGYENSGGKYEICSSNLTITTSKLDNYGPVSCNGVLKPLDVNKFYYEIRGTCDDCKYGVSRYAGDFYTRIEVTVA